LTLILEGFKVSLRDPLFKILDPDIILIRILGPKVSLKDSLQRHYLLDISHDPDINFILILLDLKFSLRSFYHLYSDITFILILLDPKFSLRRLHLHQP